MKWTPVPTIRSLRLQVPGGRARWRMGMAYLCLVSGPGTSVRGWTRRVKGREVDCDDLVQTRRDVGGGSIEGSILSFVGESPNVWSHRTRSCRRICLGVNPLSVVDGVIIIVGSFDNCKSRTRNLHRRDQFLYVLFLYVVRLRWVIQCGCFETTRETTDVRFTPDDVETVPWARNRFSKFRLSLCLKVIRFYERGVTSCWRTVRRW